MKNDHIVYAIGTKDDGTNILVAGLTADGIDALAAGLTLNFAIPPGLRNITACIIFAGATAPDLRERFAQTGLPIDQFPS
jgi:hypothetical protein